MTYQLVVIYHQPTDPDAFDRHYAETHAPLASTLPGLRSYTTVSPDPDADGTRAEHLVATLTFDDAQAFQAAMSSDAGQAAVGDLGNFASGGATIVSGEVTTIV